MLVIPLRLRASPLRLLKLFVPVFESQDFLDVKSVLARTPILRDPVDQHRDFRHWRIHPVEQAQFEGQRYLLESFRPIRLDPPIFDLLGASDDLR